MMTGYTHAASSDWRITQPEWTDYHEAQFGQFVTQLGKAVEARKCATVADCLQSPANMYYGTDAPGIRYFSDCADLPYYLRAYFAWKNGLPFSIQTGLKANPIPEGELPRDIRYSSYGNYVTSRYDVVSRRNSLRIVKYADGVKVLNETLINSISSGTFRMIGDSSGDVFTDFYPAKVDRGGIRPGTMIYDPNGHVAIIYKVTDQGRIFYIDAHPDNSLTMGLFTSKFMRSKPQQGAGFKNFRPTRLVDAKMDSSGAYIGGRIVGARNEELSSYGVEQYYGNRPDPNGDWKQGQFVVNNQKVNFYDYVQLRLLIGELHIDPLYDMKAMMDDICVNLKDRVAAVDAARAAGIHLKPHPVRLPENIYGTDGDWEAYASPSRDARLKTSFVDLLNQAKQAMDKYRRRDSSLAYNGGNLAKDLYGVYTQGATTCKFSYTTSSGKTLLMNMEAARQRLFNMSFDPFHCPELRWGARMPEEVASCQDDSNKRAWYNGEKWLRFQTERRYDQRMDYTVDQLTGPLPGVGVAAPPDVDIVTYLKSQM
ncbi:MAG: hypothetical protein J7501_00350 [Bdellovibrio sp.]|nr:hypothetical protein [Bdellovibrio sp.]